MRAISIVASAVLLASMVGCASNQPVAKAPPPIAYNKADFNPQSEFDLSFAPAGDVERPAVKRSAPSGTSYQPRLVSRERE